MNLLPKDHKEFRQKEYWDTFFKKRGKKAFEWYGEYNELCGILHKYIKVSENILQIGCGNSTLCNDLYDVGYRSIRSIDISDVVIRQMSEQNRSRPELIFEKMDVMNMSYSDGSHSVVLDKGTLDALMTDSTEEVTAKIDKMFSEIARVLRVGGRYVCVSLLQPHILQYTVNWFMEAGWPIRIIRCTEADASKPPEERIFPVFVLVCTKFKKMAGSRPVLELSLSSEGNLCRLDQPDSLVQSVRGCQQFSALRARLARAGAGVGGGEDHSGGMEEVCLELRSQDSAAVKYSIYLTERSQTCRLLFAAFIVPQGREVEWLFATAEGRRQLSVSADCQRLIVVHLGRDAKGVSSLEEVQSELSQYVLEFAPPNLPSNYKVPFLSAGADNVGSRTERCRGHSNLSGDYVVEDVEVDDQIYRRLIFLDRPNLTQSEAVLKTTRDKKSKKLARVVDPLALTSTYHSLMIGALGQYLSKPATVLIVGLGGGSLPGYINSTFPLSNTHVVELDPAILDVAKQQFGFRPGERLTVTIQDGVKYISECEKKYSVIMLDVDSKDISSGMSCPPAPFTQADFLRSLAGSLEPGGMFVLNLVCRDRLLRTELLERLTAVWRSVLCNKLDEDVNEVVFCTNSDKFGKEVAKKSLTTGFKLVNDHVKKALNTKEDLIDIQSCLKKLNINK